MSRYISGLPAVASGGVTGAELIEVSQVSTSVRISAATISAAAADNSYNDSASGFVTAGFAVGDRVKVTGFTGNTANNIFVGVITALTTGKMTIGGTDGDVIVDDAAGETVVVAKWTTVRVSVDLLAQGFLAADITPAQITANQNDYNPTDLATASVVRLSADAARDVTGLAGGTDGRMLVLVNAGAQMITLKDDDAGSTAGNRFALTADVELAADAVVALMYDGTASRWRVIGGSGGGSGLPAGGTTGQVLAKASAVDGDAEWVDAPTGGAAPFFHATRSADQTDITGNGAVATVIWNNEDHAATFASLNTSTGEITINVAGNYLINTALTLGSASTADFARVYIRRNGVDIGRGSIFVDNEAFWFPSASCTAVLAAGDIITITAEVFGVGANTADLLAEDVETFVQITKLPGDVLDYIWSTFFTTTPTASEVLALHVAGAAFTIPADFTAALQSSVETNPTASFALDVQQNGTTIGTITVSTAGAVTATTVGGTAKTIAAGDVLKIVAPSSADATAANMAFTIIGVR